MHRAAALSILALGGVPMFGEGDDLAEAIATSLVDNEVQPLSGDIIVLAQKIVSKVEGRLVALDHVVPSDLARKLADESLKDPRLVELILSETDEVVRVKPGLLIVRHRLGLVMANAGIDQSNVDHAGGAHALLLPIDPDDSCRKIRAALNARFGVDLGVVIIDSLGRAWRNGTAGTAIGVAGIAGLVDLRGRRDVHGRMLESSELGLADEIAAAASLAMGQADEGRPIVLVRGVTYPRADGSAADLIRPLHMDLFR